MMVVSYLELPNKGQGKSNDAIGVNCHKDKSSMTKVGVNDPKQL